MKKEFRILMLEDLAADAAMLNRELRRGQLAFRSKHVTTKEEFLHELEHHPPDVILSDHGLPEFDGFAALGVARDKCPDVPFIFVTGALGEEFTIRSFESGATDYVLKNKLSNLVPVVRRALQEAEEKRLRQKTKEKLRASVRALRRSEARKCAILETALDGILSIDHAGKIREWNPAASRILGYHRAEALGRTVDELIIPESLRELYHGGLTNYLMTGSGSLVERPIELSLRRADATEFRAELAITRVSHARPTSYTILVRDITERKKAEAEIRRLNEELGRRVCERTSELEATNRELEAFNYSVSHDLRTPLRHMDGFVQELLVDAGTVLSEASRAHLRTISEATKQMGQLIDDLLAFSRLGRAEMNKTRIGLDEVVKAARQDLRQEVVGRNIKWVIGPLDEVWGDVALLRQVLVNLISNAVKYTRTRAEARIEMGSTTTEAETTFFIRDNGVGFDMKYAKKLFGVFQRLHRQADFEGTGIGLANVRRVVERHGGRTWAEGAVNSGATFYFSLPKPLEADHGDKQQVREDSGLK